MKLLEHFRAMQSACSAYLAPGSYTDREGVEYNSETRKGKATGFIGDMVYALDGPEQREAQAAAEKMLSDIDSVTAVAAEPGNAYADDYMLGMANGLLLAQSIVKGTEPAFLTMPTKSLGATMRMGEAAAIGNTVASFIPDALRTCSGSFHGSKVPVVVLINAVAHFVQSAERLDDVKKVLFYGVETPKGAAIYRQLIANFPMLGVSQFDETVVCLADNVPERERDLLHGILGVATEAGELAEILQNYLLGETPDMDPVHIAEESGDDLWYRAIIFNQLGTTFPAEMDRVIRKLRTRFPDKFTEADAGQRDLAAERATLETGFPTPQNAERRVSPRTADMDDVCSAERGSVERQHTDPSKRGFEPR